MNELSLFTGAGGGIWGSKLLGWRTIGYVEKEEYRCKVIEQRIRDGIFDDAPIWQVDIGEFNQRCSHLYRGVVDVLTAGFPCQPFSVAGKQFGENDPRNMWPETIECIRLVRPRYCLLENVPGLLNHGYIQRIFGDLAESGYDCRWKIISAAEVGAPHIRKRLWILAYAREVRCDSGRPEQPLQGIGESCKTPLADATEIRRDRHTEKPGGTCSGKEEGWMFELEGSSSAISDAAGTRLAQWKGKERKWSYATIDRSQWWAVEPNVGRVADGVANRGDRIAALGDGQVPQCMAAAWKILSEGIVQ